MLYIVLQYTSDIAAQHASASAILEHAHASFVNQAPPIHRSYILSTRIRSALVTVSKIPRKGSVTVPTCKIHAYVATCSCGMSKYSGNGTMSVNVSNISLTMTIIQMM